MEDDAATAMLRNKAPGWLLSPPVVETGFSPVSGPPVRLRAPREVLPALGLLDSAS